MMRMAFALVLAFGFACGLAAGWDYGTASLNETSGCGVSTWGSGERYMVSQAILPEDPRPILGIRVSLDAGPDVGDPYYYDYKIGLTLTRTGEPDPWTGSWADSLATREYSHHAVEPVHALELGTGIDDDFLFRNQVTGALEAYRPTPWLVHSDPNDPNSPLVDNGDFERVAMMIYPVSMDVPAWSFGVSLDIVQHYDPNTGEPTWNGGDYPGDGAIWTGYADAWCARPGVPGWGDRIYNNIEHADMVFATLVPVWGDASLDDQVDVSDLGILSAGYGQALDPNANVLAAWQAGDFNLNGVVDVGDLGVLGSHYDGIGGGLVPEPTMTALWVLSTVVVLLRRRAGGAEGASR